MRNDGRDHVHEEAEDKMYCECSESEAAASSDQKLSTDQTPEEETGTNLLKALFAVITKKSTVKREMA